MRRARVRFAGRTVEFVDREAAIRWLEEVAEKGTHVVYVVYGPEGCGKTALLRQAKEVLEGNGYMVTYVNPLTEAPGERLSVTGKLRELASELGLHLLGEAYRLVEKAAELLYAAIRRGAGGRIALLADDVFQAIGLGRAEALVKSLLNMIEYPPVEYERIVVIASSSEGVTRERIGRHRWAWILALWNMPKRGFEELYSLLPSPKPPLEEAWRLTGGNPKMLEELHAAGWDAGRIVGVIVESRGLDGFVRELDGASRRLLEEAVEDPDAIFESLGEEHARRLRDRLIERNLLIKVPDRRDYLWVDEPPPERDPELGIGRYYAWQTPLHREAVRVALGLTGGERR